jgi:hypothetical protein
MTAIVNGAAFAKGREFAAWLGLVPKQMSTDDPRSHHLKDALHRSQAHADRLRQPPACPMLASRGGGPSARSITRCTVTAGNGGCLVAGQAGNAFRHEPRPASATPITGLALPDRRVISVVPQPSAVADDFGAPNMLLRRVAIADNRVKLTAIGVTFTTIPALMTRA